MRRFRFRAAAALELRRQQEQRGRDRASARQRPAFREATRAVSARSADRRRATAQLADARSVAGIDIATLVWHRNWIVSICQATVDRPRAATSQTRARPSQQAEHGAGSWRSAAGWRSNACGNGRWRGIAQAEQREELKVHRRARAPADSSMPRCGRMERVTTVTHRSTVARRATAHGTATDDRDDATTDAARPRRVSVSCSSRSCSTRIRSSRRPTASSSRSSRSSARSRASRTSRTTSPRLRAVLRSGHRRPTATRVRGRTVMSVGSFSASLSGLNANQQKLSVIGNNLANINTVGFKASTVNFADLVSQSVGGAEREPDADRPRRRRPARSRRTSRRAASRPPASRPTSRFRATASSWSATPTQRAYTRAGNFSFDADGMLVTPDGQPVQGYTAIDPLTGADRHDRPAGDIVVPPGVLRPPVATTQLRRRQSNLDAQRGRGRDVHGVGADLRRARRRRTSRPINFTKTGAGAWDYSMTVPGAEVTGGTAGTPFSIGTGTLDVRRHRQALPGQRRRGGRRDDHEPGVGATARRATNFTWDLVDANGVGDAHAASRRRRRRRRSRRTARRPAPCRASSRSIRTGELVASFGIGRTVVVGQLALATFNNPQGLVKLGTNLFSESEAVGHPERRRRRHAAAAARSSAARSSSRTWTSRRSSRR